MELSFRCGSVRKVSRLLEDEGLGGLLAQSELESIMIEAKAIQSLIPERPRNTLPRMVGTIAMMMGVAGIWIEMGAIHFTRSSPGGYGVAAVILGVILVLKPSSAKTEL